MVLLFPLDGTIFSCASTSSASDLKSESLSFSRTDLRLSVRGYSVFSVRGYDMYPLVYRSSASFMAVVGGIPILLASTCICVVSNGAGLYSSFATVSYSITVPSFSSEIFAMIASAASFSQKWLPSWHPLNASIPNFATTSQNGTGTNFSISSCLSTRSFRVGLCTLPTDMKFFPTCPEERDMSLVSTAPQDRSTICLVSAASASFLSGSARTEKADSTSPFVSALNFALLTEILPSSVLPDSVSWYTPMALTVSIPISSPSLS